MYYDSDMSNILIHNLKISINSCVNTIILCMIMGDRRNKCVTILAFESLIK